MSMFQRFGLISTCLARVTFQFRRYHNSADFFSEKLRSKIVFRCNWMTKLNSAKKIFKDQSMRLFFNTDQLSSRLHGTVLLPKQQSQVFLMVLSHQRLTACPATKEWFQKSGTLPAKMIFS